MIRFSVAMLCLALTALPAAARGAATASHGDFDALVASYASANGVPVSLVHRVIMRESRYNPHVIGRGGAMGLMQIKHATARGLGYTGSASGLLDPETNLSYAVRYLAGAYRAAGGNENQAVSYYARGYYYAAKRQGTRVEALAQPAN
jgi:soluble lytic murein transglycosylase-like protein